MEYLKSSFYTWNYVILYTNSAFALKGHQLWAQFCGEVRPRSMSPFLTPQEEWICSLWPYILHCLVFYHKSSFFILCKFYWCIFRFTELFSSHFQSYVKPIYWSSIPIFYLLVIYVFQAIHLTHFYNSYFILYFSFLL